MSTTVLSWILRDSISPFKLDYACEKLPPRLTARGPEELCDNSTSSHTFKFCRRSPPPMALFVLFVLLTTWNCVQTVEALNAVSIQAQTGPEVAVRLPENSPEAARFRAISAAAHGPESASPLADNPEAVSPPADNPEAVSPPADSSEALSPQADNPEAVSPPADSPEAVSSPADSPESVSPPADSSEAVSPQAHSPEPHSPEAGSGTDRFTRPGAMFVFGDSLVDPGNNNFILSLAKANVLFNGIDFPGGPTGRFCNGRTVVDILCDILGVPYPPAFLNPQTNGSKILHGVNYASGAGGILDATGANFLNRVCMNQQITYFQGTTLPQLEAQLGAKGASALLASSLVGIVMGSNDYINNYFLLDTSTPSQYSPEQFNILLLNSFSRQLTTLYNSGFRMFYVSGIGPIGCIPHQLAISGQPDCVSSVNTQAQDFNVLARSLLEGLNSVLPDAMFLFVDSYETVTDLINNPDNYGFTVVNEGCCGGGLYRGQIVCQPAAEVCPDRTKYVFWDAYHTTEASNLVLANAIYNGGTNAITPINIRQLLAQRLNLDR